MTIVVDAEDDRNRSQKQLYKLINVIQVEDVTEVPGVSRDLALIKVQVDSDTRGEVVQLCEIFRARIVDVGLGNGDRRRSPATRRRSTAWSNCCGPFGIIEMVRTGVVAMARGEHVLSPNGYEPRDGIWQRPSGQRTKGVSRGIHTPYI